MGRFSGPGVCSEGWAAGHQAVLGGRRVPAAFWGLVSSGPSSYFVSLSVTFRATGPFQAAFPSLELLAASS